ncbi:hypothetical protein O9G_001159 [Rozella allomycis CSF55]|uniref:Uncharacterized protein n=1 Tax=Rozella allomycis (strain CSF55) TaxID=988480 RepID=A0A075ASQ8_ROZAC|nr:hypothetical protein O9G_001159 [Rozella allomycis CSF55]|eukprot:EPZ33190.1 hypothetical protein O9G_001159 [Rozella allomycis CSF55]
MRRLFSLTFLVYGAVYCLDERNFVGEVSDIGYTADNAEAWTSVDNPARAATLLNSTFEYTFDKLPKSGKPDIQPWSGSYWPTYLDSINYKWAGAHVPSPVEKYERAFNVTGLANLVSSNIGINANWLKKVACQTDDDCGGTNVGRCVSRDIEPKKICIPTWYGICHAWSAAAIEEMQPKYRVKVNNVIFDINDIKALVSVMYDYTFKNTVSLSMIGKRCNQKKTEIDLDPMGRPKDPGCRDMNAATFHTLMANVVGINKKTFYFNKEMDSEVWNQPMAGFTVNSANKISKEDARKEFIVRDESFSSEGPFTPKAVDFVKVQSTVSYVKETNPRTLRKTKLVVNNMTLDYILELDADGKIIGGEWIGNTILNHPGFVVFVKSREKNSAIFGKKMKWVNVKAILDASTLGTPTKMYVPILPEITAAETEL